jgi:lysozyme family protein
MASLDLSIEKTLKYEGLYSNDPEDPGGETWRGIARHYHPEWAGWVAIDAAKAQRADITSLARDPAMEEHVRTFYRLEFAHALYEAIEDQEVLDELFDFGVNVNPPNAVRAMQESLKSLTVGPLVIDGEFGAKTLGAINAVNAKRLLEEFRARQAAYYVDSILRRFIRNLETVGVDLPDETAKKATRYAVKFALGWLRRVMA